MKMARGVLGVIVDSDLGVPFRDLGLAGDAALTPFGGKYRFIDFALATLANSDVATCVCIPEPTLALRARLARTGLPGRHPRRPVVRALAGLGSSVSRAARLRGALAAVDELVRAHDFDTLLVLRADHILQLDVRPLLAAHRERAPGVTLAAMPVRAGDEAGRAVLDIAPDWCVERAADPPACVAARGFGYVWTGELVLHAALLPALLDPLAGALHGGEADVVAALAAAGPVAAYDVLDSRVPGTPPGRGTYWHEPTSLEHYYDAQMDLCTLRPRLDLYNGAWPLPAHTTGLGPARVMADAAGRPGQALNTLVSDGTLVRGSIVINAVVGPNVTIESGAEVEDSVLLDGCRIGRGARIRRTVVGAGVTIGEAEELGYGATPPGRARFLPSGLTVVPALWPTAAAAAAAGR